MKHFKILGLIIAICMIMVQTSSLYSQSIEIVNAEPVIQRNGTSNIVSHIQFANKTDKSIYMGIDVIMEDICEGHLVWLCVIQTCLEPKDVDFTSSRQFHLPPDSISPAEYFKITFITNNKKGHSKIRYRFYDYDNPEDYTDFVQDFYVGQPVSVAEPLIGQYSFDNVYPNPVSNFFTISTETKNFNNGAINIYNSTGIRVISEKISPMKNEYMINSSTLPSGAYYYEISIDGRKGRANRFIKK